VPDLGSDRIDFELDLLAVGLVCFDFPNAVLKFDLGYYLKSLLLDGLDYLRERFRIHRRELVGEPPMVTRSKWSSSYLRSFEEVSHSRRRASAARAWSCGQVEPMHVYQKLPQFIASAIQAQVPFHQTIERTKLGAAQV
jgi:hypothetical protein